MTFTHLRKYLYRWVYGWLCEFELPICICAINFGVDLYIGEEEMAVTRLAKQGSDKEFMHSALLLDEKSGSDHDYLVAHPVPLKWCLDPWRLGRQFYDSTKFGIVQYVRRLCYYITTTSINPSFSLLLCCKHIANFGKMSLDEFFFTFYSLKSLIKNGRMRNYPSKDFPRELSFDELEFLVFTLQLILDLGHLCREKSRF